MTADGLEGHRKRSLARAHKLQRRELLPPERIIKFENPIAIMKVLTSERIRLCEITREEAVSISAVAQKLERDPKSVRRDAQSLERVGILRTRIATNPGHGNIRMVEAIAARLELRTPI